MVDSIFAELLYCVTRIHSQYIIAYVIVILWEKHITITIELGSPYKLCNIIKTKNNCVRGSSINSMDGVKVV